MSVSPRYLRVDVGAPARFACVVSGFPVRGVTWLRNGRQISPGGKAGSGGGDGKVALSRDGTVRPSRGLCYPEKAASLQRCFLETLCSLLSFPEGYSLE